MIPVGHFKLGFLNFTDNFWNWVNHMVEPYSKFNTEIFWDVLNTYCFYDNLNREGKLNVD